MNVLASSLSLLLPRLNFFCPNPTSYARCIPALISAVVATLPQSAHQLCLASTKLCECQANGLCTGLRR